MMHYVHESIIVYSVRKRYTRCALVTGVDVSSSDLEAVAAAQPDRPAHLQGVRVVTWGHFDARADALAARLIAAGLDRQAKVAAFLYNGPEYLETYYAAFKAGFAPVNTNYRYGSEELFYLFDNADAQAVVFHAGFTDVLAALRPRTTGRASGRERVCQYVEI